VVTYLSVRRCEYRERADIHEEPSGLVKAHVVQPLISGEGA